MSKTYEVLSEKQQSEQRQKKQEEPQQKKQELMTTTAMSPPTAPETPEEFQAELARFREAAANNSRVSFFGKILRFVKGAWVLGQEKEKIPDRSRWIAIMGEARHGLIEWTTVIAEDGSTKREPVHTIGKIGDGYQPPPRESLGKMDKSLWRTGLDGKPEDPIRPCVYLPLLSYPDGEKVMTFTTSTKTGLPRFWQLIERIAWIGQRHLGQYPILELQVSGYDDRNFGWIHVPDWNIVGWVGRPDPALLLGHANNDGGDGSEEPPPYDTVPEYADRE